MRKVLIVYNGIERNKAFADAARRGSLAALRAEKAAGEICIELTNDEMIHGCNRDFRFVDRPTDVLSFPAAEGEELIGIPDGHLGDIMISVETAARQAAELGHSTEREITFLAVHGTLHVLGYDHIEPEDEELMTARQREIMGKIAG
jgi:probable rRNA maturation factor